MEAQTMKSFYDSTRGIMGEQFDRWIIIGHRCTDGQRCLISHVGEDCPEPFMDMARKSVEWVDAEDNSANGTLG
tara:strand:+ start:473 stop:694 length:222 start_codon:yes stop_codon:yes gene_type:complete